MKNNLSTWLGLALLLFFTSCQVAENKKPNFLILISDDQRWDQLSCAENPIIPELTTPNIDKLAEEGVSFRNAFVTTPICAVSRACIMTGMYAASHGMNHFNTPIEPNILSQSYPALLKESGYRTGLIGKYGMGTAGTEKHFDVFNAWHHQGSYFHKTDSGRIHNSVWLAHEAEKFFQNSSAEQPFCLTICYKAPHHPYQPDERDSRLFDDVNIPDRATDSPENYAKMAAHIMDSSLNRWCYFDERRDKETKDHFEKNFLRCVASLDRSVGMVMKSLQEAGFEENTITIFLSDHGYLWGEHGLGGKWLLYEESIRIPIIIHDPRAPKKRQGLIKNPMVLSIDIAPTLLDLANISLPDNIDGQSLLPLLGRSNAPIREEFLMEHVGIIDVENPIPDSRGVRTTDWKYIRYVNTDPEVEELYYLKSDPLESKNLADEADYQTILSDFRYRVLGSR